MISVVSLTQGRSGVPTCNCSTKSLYHTLANIQDIMYVRTYVCTYMPLCMCTGILYTDNCMYVQTLYVCSRGSDSVAIMRCLTEKGWQNGVKQRMHADTYEHHKINSHSLKAYTKVPRHMCLNGMCVCVCVHVYVHTYACACACGSIQRDKVPLRTRLYVCSMDTHSPRVHTSVL